MSALTNIDVTQRPQIVSESPWEINTLMHFWSILGQKKSSLVIFHEKGERVQFSFGHNIISNGLI